MMHQILSACAETASNVTVSEAKFLEHYLQAYRLGKSSYASDLEAFFGESREFASLNREILLTLLRAAHDHLGARCLLLKWPFVTPYGPELMELLPAVRMILMVRDPRDIVASLIKVGLRMEAGGKENPFGRTSLEKTIRYFHDCYRPVYPLLEIPEKKRRIHVVRYEDLVSNTAVELKKMESFLGLSVQAGGEGGSDLKFDKSLWEEHKAEWLTELSGRAISTASIGSSRDTLTSEEIAAIEDRTQTFFSAFGYRRSE